MNKNILIILIVGISGAILLGGGLLFLNQQNSDSGKMMATDSKMTKDDTSESGEQSTMKDDAMTSEEDKMMAADSNSKYVEYTNSTLANTDSEKRVLFFYANWCPTCRPVDTEIRANTDKIPEDMTIIRVNYNDPDTDQDEKDLAKKYNVTYQHTFVQIDENGKEIKKWNGGDLDQILSNVN